MNTNNEFKIGDKVKARYLTDNECVILAIYEGKKEDYFWVKADAWLSPTTVPKEYLYNE